MQAHARVRVRDLLRTPERLLEHFPRAAEVADVAEGVAEVRGESNLGRRVVGTFLLQTTEAFLEELDGPLWLAKRRVALTERRVDVWAPRWIEETRGNRLLETLGRGGVLSRTGLCKP